MKKNLFCALLLCTAMLLLCTGCGIYLNYLTVRFTQPLAEGQQVVILLHPPQGQLDETVSRPDTEIGQYLEDGWTAAEYGPVRTHTETGKNGKKAKVIRHFVRMFSDQDMPCKTGISEEGGWPFEDGYKAFCEEFGSFRCALTDADGNILKISEECTLCPDDHFGYPDTVLLDPETMQLTPEHWIMKTWHGRTLRSWAQLAGIVTFFAASLLVWVLLNDKMRRRTRRILAGLCLIPCVIYIALKILVCFVPRFRAQNNINPYDALYGFGLLLLFILAETAGQISRKKRRESKQDESS